jgi:hypothetical protein
MCPHPEFARLLSWQIKSRGKSGSGIFYVSLGRRMSGEMNTGLGNCGIASMCVSVVMQGRKYDMLVDGDDCIVFMRNSYLAWFLAVAPFRFQELGFEVKFETIARCLPEIRWCQSNPIQVSPAVWKFVRDPAKIFSTAVSGFKYVEENLRLRRRWINTVGMMELILNLGVPVLQEFALALMRVADTDEHITLQDSDPMYHRLHRELHSLNMRCLAKRDPRPIQSCARLSYYQAFGVSVELQMLQEQFFRTWSFPLVGDFTLAVDLDPGPWQFVHLFTPEVYRPGE